MVKTIAIIIIMLAVNVFMFFSLRRALIRLDYTLRHAFLQKSSVDNEEEVSPAVEPEPEVMKQAAPTVEKTIVYAEPAVIREVSYRNKNLRDEYRTIKEFSQFTPESALTLAKERISNAVPAYDVHSGMDFAGFLGKLDFDTVYELSLLDTEEQEQVLRENAKPEYLRIIDLYKEEHDGKFEASDFYAYLRQMADIYNAGFVVMTGSAEDDGRVLRDGSTVRYDDSICEGARVIHENRMYDYSL